MFCPYCGKSLADQASFCMGCGKQIPNPNAQAQPQTAAPAAPVAPAPAPAPTPVAPAPAAVAPVAVGDGVNITVKKQKSRAWIVVVSIIAVVAILAGLAFFFLYESDEDKIRNRIESFSTACNEGDLEGMFNCFDKKTRKYYETTIKLVEGALGGALGFDIPLGDMVGIAGMESGGFDVNIEIQSIQINGDTATVTLKDSGAYDMGEEPLVMVKEDGDWYIDFEATTGTSIKSGFGF